MFPYIRIMTAYVNIRSNPEVCSALFPLLASSNPQLFSTKGFNFYINTYRQLSIFYIRKMLKNFISRRRIVQYPPKLWLGNISLILLLICFVSKHFSSSVNIQYVWIFIKDFVVYLLVPLPTMLGCSWPQPCRRITRRFHWFFHHTYCCQQFHEILDTDPEISMW